MFSWFKKKKGKDSRLGSLPSEKERAAISKRSVSEMGFESDRKILVLDMDETLIHKSNFPPHESVSLLPVHIDGCYVFKRPGVDEFLARVTDMFDTYIYTAGHKDYAKPVLDVLCPMIPEDHRFYRDACSSKRGKCRKNLRILTKDMSRIILIDDSANAKKFYPDNNYQITRWNGTPNDSCLLGEVVPMLESCSRAEDVRDVIRSLPQRRTRRALSEMMLV